MRLIPRHARESLEDERRKGLRLLRLSRIATRTLAVLVVAWVLHSFIQIFDNWPAYSRVPIAETGVLLNPVSSVLLDLVIWLIAVIWFVRLYRSAGRLPERYRKCQEHVREQLLNCVHVPSQLRATIQFFKTPYDDAPEVIGLTVKEARVTLSGGFLELLSRDPEAAFAVLEHELAHITHKDVSPRPFANTFWHVLNRIAIALIVPEILGVSFSLWVNSTSSGRQFLFRHFPVHSVTETASTEVVTTYRGGAGNGQIGVTTHQTHSRRTAPTPQGGGSSAVTTYSQAGNGQIGAADLGTGRGEAGTAHPLTSSSKAPSQYSQAVNDQIVTISPKPYRSQLVTTSAEPKRKQKAEPHNVPKETFLERTFFHLLRLLPASAQRTMAISFLASFAVIPVLIWLLLVLNFRRERWLSERMADLEVIFYARGRGLMRALDFFSLKDTGKAGTLSMLRRWLGARTNIFSFHPSVASRKKYILARS
jgi:hypothetical protein